VTLSRKQHGDVSLQPGVAGLLDVAHASLTHPIDDLIVRNRPADHGESPRWRHANGSHKKL